MPNLYSYRPSIELELSTCKDIDCKTVSFTDISPIFLNYGLNWITLKKVEIDVYKDSELISSNDVTSEIFIDISGTVSTTGDSTVLSGDSTAFESELATLEYIMLDNSFYYMLSSVIDDEQAIFSTIPDEFTGVSAKRISLNFSLGASAFGGADGDSIEDGVYTFIYRITYDYTWDNDGTPELVEDETAQVEFTEVMYCQVACCVKKKLAALADNIDCCVEDNDIMDAMVAWAWLESLDKQAGCANIDSLNTTLELLKEYCLDTPCNC